MTGVVSNAEEIVIKTTEISAAIAIYQKWRAIGDRVQTAYTELQNAIALAGTAISSVLARHGMRSAFKPPSSKRKLAALPPGSRAWKRWQRDYRLPDSP